MPVRRIDFGITDFVIIFYQCLHNLATTLRREAPVSRKRDQQKLCLYVRQCRSKIPAKSPRGIKIIERLGDE